MSLFRSTLAGFEGKIMIFAGSMGRNVANDLVELTL